MAIENANSHPFKVALTKETDGMYANSHPYQVAIVGGGAGSEGRVVTELPEEGEPGYIYLILKESTESGDIYDEYMWVLLEDGETHGWEHIGATNEVTITLYDSLGSNTDGAITQRAATRLIYPSTVGAAIAIGERTDFGLQTIAIGYGAKAYMYSIVIGNNATSGGASGRVLYSVALGQGADANNTEGSVAIGAFSKPTEHGEVNIGSTMTGWGYNYTNYRRLSGVYDPQQAHDAATKGYVDNNFATQGYVDNGLGLKEDAPTSYTTVIPKNSWSATSGISPFTVSTQIYLPITDAREVELVNDNAVAFGNYGFSIGSVDTINESIKLYALEQPDQDYGLTIKVRI